MPVTTNSFQRTRTALRFVQAPRFGNLLFTDSVTGSATGGATPDAPSATLIQAQTAATASNDDVVYVGHDHAEAVAGAAAMTFSKAGVTYQGLGQGRLRPTITWGTGIGAQIIVSGANITFRNLVFDFTGFDAITACISVTGADVAFEDCEFLMQTAAISPVIGILTAATATRFRVERCRFLGVQTTSSAATLVGCIKHEVGEDFLIRGNYFRVKATQAILNATGITAGCIADNYFHIFTGTKAIALNASTSLMEIINNRIVVASGTTPVVGTGASMTGNTYTTEALAIGTPTASTF